MPEDSNSFFDPTDETVIGLSPGQVVFGRFKLERLVGQGAMGLVWRGQDEVLDEPVALKFLPQVVVRDPESLDEMKREVKQALRLTHQNIVRTRDLYREGNMAAIAMEWVEGKTLGQMRLDKANRVLEPADLEPLLPQLCAALDYAHQEARIVHRDIKPSNVMVTTEGKVKITDFGIARSLSDTVTQLTSQGTSGTPSYMSPQQMMGKRAHPADDIYALGATLYQLMTGKPPFYTGDLGMQVLHSVPEPVADRRAELGVAGQPIPEAWERLVARCLEKEPEKRPSSGAEVLGKLEGRGKKEEVELDLDDEATVVGLGVPRNEGENVGRFEGFSASLRKVEGAKVDGEDSGDEAVAREEIESARVAAPRRGGGGKLVAGVLLLAGVLAVLGWQGWEHGWFAREATDPVSDETVAQVEKADGSGDAMEQLAPSPGSLSSVPDDTPVAGRDWTVPEVGMEFVWIPAMDMWVGKYEVTNAEFRRFRSGHDSGIERTGISFNDERQPVVEVSYEDAVAFCEWLTLREREAGRLPEGFSYRLPDGDEWTTFARCGTNREFPWGDSMPPTRGNYYDYTASAHFGMAGDLENYRDGFVLTAPVEESGRNEWGLYGVGGNVAEWTSELRGSSRVWRGGTWGCALLGALRVDFRPEVSPTAHNTNSGFRVVLGEERTIPQGEVAGLEETTEPETGVDWTVPEVGMEFVWIPAMNMWAGKYEVTNAQFRRFRSEHDSGHFERDDRRLSLNNAGQPVVRVTYEDAVAFCEWLTRRERVAGRLPEGYRYRLPDGDEWTTFARCGTDREYPWGDSMPPRRGNYAGQAARAAFPSMEIIDGYIDFVHAVTAPVEDLRRNEWGLHGVGGNVWEWTSEPHDWSRVRRGGSWIDDDPAKLRVEYRGISPPSRGGFEVGFRVVLGADPVSPQGTTAGLPVAMDTALVPVAGSATEVELPGGLKLKMVWIAPGEFTMGSPPNEAGRWDSEGPQTRVRLTRGYWLGKYPVTQRQWQAVTGNNPSSFKQSGLDAPVERVSWDDAMAFCRWLTERERQAGRLPEGYEYTLPSEAQWEYAARAGTATRWSFGDSEKELDNYGWHSGNSDRRTHAVGGKWPNPLGLYDIYGNVREWTRTWFAASLPGGSVTDFEGPDEGRFRVNRGGSWNFGDVTSRSAWRSRDIPTDRLPHVGFRLALAPSPPD